MAKWMVSVFPIEKSEEIFVDTCRYGHFDVAGWMLEKWPDLDVSCMDIAFCYSCEADDFKFARLLVERYPNIDVTSEGFKVFYKACYNGNLPLVKWLAEIRPAAIYVDVVKKALDIACDSGHTDIAKWLLSIPCMKPADGRDAFIKACKGGYVDIVVWLLTEYPNMDISLIAENTLLQLAERGHDDMVKWILQKCPKSGTGYRAKLAMWRACLHGHVKIIKLFVASLLFLTIDDIREMVKNACVYRKHKVAVYLLYDFVPTPLGLPSDCIRRLASTFGSDICQPCDMHINIMCQLCKDRV